MDKKYEELMHALEYGHWWFIARREFILKNNITYEQEKLHS